VPANFGEQNPVSRLHVERPHAAVIEHAALADGHHFAFGGQLLREVGMKIPPSVLFWPSMRLTITGPAAVGCSCPAVLLALVGDRVALHSALAWSRPVVAAKGLALLPASACVVAAEFAQ